MAVIRRAPRVVFLTPVMPAPAGNGLAMRAGLFLEGMARHHAVDVVVIGLAEDAPTPNHFTERLASSCSAFAPKDPYDQRSWSQALLATPEGRQRARKIYPLPAVSRVPSPAALAELRKLTDDAQLVHVMRSYMAPCVDFVFDGGAGPSVTLDLDELDSDVQRQLGADEDAERFERLERYYLPLMDRVYVASREEAERVTRKHSSRVVTVVPNAVRVHDDCAESGAEEFDLLFIGNLSYAPNIDAVHWLCHEILPLLAGATLAIVGSGPGPEALSLAQTPGVTVFGDVAEVTSWYRRSRVAVVPLRVGGGSATKTLEALAHSRPVVSTSLGARGAGNGEAHGILVADSATAFASACRRLLDDRAAAARIGTAGQSNLIPAAEVVEQVARLTQAAAF